jgi:hypothetical protein
MSAVFTWISTNWALIATVLLGVSESLSIVFPSTTGFGGILAGLIKFLQGLGTKPPTTPTASS